MNTKHIRDNQWDSNTFEVKRLHGHCEVNIVERWSESGLSYHGRSHGHVDDFNRDFIGNNFCYWLFLCWGSPNNNFLILNVIELSVSKISTLLWSLN
jgi:hypothetical protein